MPTTPAMPETTDQPTSVAPGPRLRLGDGDDGRNGHPDELADENDAEAGGAPTQQAAAVVAGPQASADARPKEAAAKGSRLATHRCRDAEHRGGDRAGSGGTDRRTHSSGHDTGPARCRARESRLEMTRGVHHSALADGGASSRGHRRSPRARPNGACGSARGLGAGAPSSRARCSRLSACHPDRAPTAGP